MKRKEQFGLGIRQYIMVLVAALALMSFQSPTDTTANTDPTEIIIQVVDLDAYEYRDIAKAFRGDELVTLKSACVPVELIAFEINEGNALNTGENYGHIQMIISQVLTDAEVVWTDHNMESLQEECLAARNGQ